MENALYIVVPCYNEQEVLPETSKRLLQKIESLIQQQKINSLVLFLSVFPVLHARSTFSIFTSDNLFYFCFIIMHNTLKPIFLCTNFLEKSTECWIHSLFIKMWQIYIGSFRNPHFQTTILSDSQEIWLHTQKN